MTSPAMPCPSLHLQCPCPTHSPCLTCLSSTLTSTCQHTTHVAGVVCCDGTEQQAYVLYHLHSSIPPTHYFPHRLPCATAPPLSSTKEEWPGHCVTDQVGDLCHPSHAVVSRIDGRGANDGGVSTRGDVLASWCNSWQEEMWPNTQSIIGLEQVSQWYPSTIVQPWFNRVTENVKF